jgi:hypothetical protein
MAASFWLSSFICPGLAVLFFLPYPFCRALAIVSLQSYSSNPGLAACPGSPVLLVLPGSHFLEVLSWQSCSACAIPFRQSDFSCPFSRCPVLAVHFWVPGSGCSIMAALSFLFSSSYFILTALC